MRAFAFLVKDAWPWAVNSSGTVESTQYRQEGCPGLHPSPALPNRGIAEPNSGAHPMRVLTAALDGVSTLKALKGRQKFHQGQQSTRCIKNTKRGSKLGLDLTILRGMWEEMQQGWPVESTVACLSL